MDGRLANRVAVVTGAAHGIGAAIARRLAAEGAAVAVLDIDEDAAIAVADSLPAGIGLRADVASASEVSAAISAVVERFGAIDIVVNNAGGALLPPVRFWELSEEDWEFVVGVNLRGPWLVTRAAAPHLIRSEHGKVVNISSVNGINGNAGLAAYSSAKAGVVGLTKTMAAELGEYGICVNAIAPGYIRFTRPKAVFTAEKVAQLELAALASQNIKKIGQPEDVAAAVAYLVSADGDQVTGQVWSVDGGGSAKGALEIKPG